MKKYLLLSLVIVPCILFSVSPEEPIIPDEMLLSPNNSITQVDIDEEDCVEIDEELSDISPMECSTANSIPHPSS